MLARAPPSSSTGGEERTSTTDDACSFLFCSRRLEEEMTDKTALTRVHTKLTHPKSQRESLFVSPSTVEVRGPPSKDGAAEMLALSCSLLCLQQTNGIRENAEIMGFVGLGFIAFWVWEAFVMGDHPFFEERRAKISRKARRSWLRSKWKVYRGRCVLSVAREEMYPDRHCFVTW